MITKDLQNVQSERLKVIGYRNRRGLFILELVLDFLLSAFFGEFLLVASSSYFFLAFFVLKKFLKERKLNFSKVEGE